MGEIRDKETAKIAIESGLTGQLILSTVHAEDSTRTLYRLVDLGVETYFLNSVLMGVVAQRLVRKVCDSCKFAIEPTNRDIDLFTNILGRQPKQLVQGKGCSNCNNLGFKGRIGIYEVLHIDSFVRDLIRAKTSEEKLRQKLKEQGFITLLRDGLLKAEAGITTIDEVLRNSIRIG